jgi:hypothetical protein
MRVGVQSAQNDRRKVEIGRITAPTSASLQSEKTMTPQPKGPQKSPGPVPRMPTDDVNKNKQKSEEAEVAGRHKNDGQDDHQKDHRGRH